MADSNSINTPLARNQNITPLEIDCREPPSSISYNLEAFHDPHDFHNKDAAKSTSLQASFTLFCSFVGVSLLSIPYSFKLAGLGLSIISMIIIAYLTWYCLSLVLIVAEAQPSNERMTLEILSHKLLGNWAVYVVQISVSLLQIGICTVILMFSSSFLDYVVCNFGIVSLCGNIPFRAVVVLMVTIPLTMINNMHWFYISSLFSSIFIFIGVITQFSFNINVLEQQPLSTDYILSKLNEFKFYNLPVFFGVAIYTFEGIGTLFSVRYAMQTPRDFPGILRNQMIMIAFLYILFPAMCYIAFGSNVPEVVTFTLPINNTLYLWVQGLLVVAALCGYSLQLFPTLKILENSSMFRHRIFDDKGRTKNPFLRYGLRIMIIFLMIIVVFSGVSFNLWISFIGAFVSTFIGFILPVLLYERQFRSNVSKKTKILNKISLYAGGIMGVLGVTQTLGIMIGIFPKAE